MYCLCLVLLCTPPLFAQTAFEQIRTLEYHRNRLAFLQNAGVSEKRQQPLVKTIQNERTTLEDTLFTSAEGEVTLAFTASNSALKDKSDMYTLTFTFDGKEVYTATKTLFSLQRSLVHSAQITYRIQMGKEHTYTFRIQEIRLHNDEGKTIAVISEKNTPNTYTFSHPELVAQWQTEYADDKDIARLLSEDEEEKRHPVPRVEDNRKPEMKHIAFRTSYDAFWYTQWHSAAWALNADLTFNSGFFLGLNLGIGDEAAYFPALAAFVAGITLISKSAGSFDIDYVTFTARAGIFVPHSEDIAFKIFAEAGAIASTFGAGAGVNVLLIGDEMVALMLGYTLFYTEDIFPLHQASVGFQVSLY